MVFLNNKKEEVDQSAWNLSQHIINQIGNLLVTASTKFRRGDIQNSYWDTEEIRILIHDDLDDEEIKKLKEYEQRICRLYSVTKKNIITNREDIGEDTKREIMSAKHQHYVEVKEYRMYIMELLGKYGYSVSKKENAAKMF
jgi:hypothetical protein